MDDQKEVIEKRKEKVINWIKQPSNLILVAIIILAAIIRFNNAIYSDGQALWWDEAEYGSAAKKWAIGIEYDINAQRPPLFQFLWALLFSLGSSEFFVKVLLVVIPSVFLVFATYLLGKEMYNKHIGLIAAFLTTVSWTFLFWTSRFQPDFFSLSFQLFAIYFMWRYWKKETTKFAVLSGLFVALGMYFKISSLLVPMTFFVLMLLRDKLKLFTKKDYYLFAATFLITMIPYFLWARYEFGKWSGFLTSGYSNQVINPTNPFAWHTLNFFYTLTEGVLFYVFLVGLISSLKFLLYIDVIIKDKNKVLDPNLFGILVFIVSAAFYIFYIRGIEDRWIFIWVPFLFFFMGHALLFIYDHLKKYSKIVAIVIILAILAFGGFAQYIHAKNLIVDKKESYQPVKMAGMWIKENSAKETFVISQSQTQTVYYSERDATSVNTFKNESEFFAFVKDQGTEKIILMVSVFEWHPPWIHEWLSKNPDKVTPVQAYFADQAQTHPLLVIYRMNPITNLTT